MNIVVNALASRVLTFQLKLIDYVQGLYQRWRGIARGIVLLDTRPLRLVGRLMCSHM